MIDMQKNNPKNSSRILLLLTANAALLILLFGLIFILISVLSSGIYQEFFNEIKKYNLSITNLNIADFWLKVERNELDANVKSVNDVTVTGTGSLGDEWGP